MPLPPDDIRARLAQLRSEFAMRAALQSEYDKEMSGKYIHEMIPFADWLAQRNAPTGKAKGGQPNLDVMRLAIGGQGPKNWLKGSVEKVIDPLKSKGNWDQPESYLKASQNPLIGPATRAQLEDAYRDSLRHQSINQWIERNLGNYIRKQLGHPNDPIRKLAEEGVLHTDPTRVEIIGGDNDMGTHANRRREMFGGQKMAKGPLAQAWEDAVDTRFEGYKIKDLQNMPEMHEGQYEPWMDKADPNTLIFEPYAFDELGFDHIVDILKQDLAEGRIRPEQLSKVSIEQAVRRTHQYDQERKKAMAETALKSTEGMPIHKDYGDGFKWIELTLPKDLPEGWTVKSLPSGGETYYDPQGVRHVHPNMGKLKDALKYEGDTMGHCVGGYCPDVAEGRSRIFSLRDAKNEPHVTIEIKPPKYSDAPREHRIQYLNELKQQDPNADWSDEGFAKWMKNRGIELPPAIKQIKGKGNAKPKKDYIPYVQDFVRSGNWSEVNDFRNTDLIRKSDLIDKFSPEELDAVGKGEYLTHGEHSDLLLKALQPPKGKAEGGEVEEEDYRGSHQAPGLHFGAPMHDVTRDMYPKDFYGPRGFHYYADYGEPKDREAYNKVVRVKDKPDEMVSIYRAIPTSVYKEALKKDSPLKHMIRKGDWVAIHKDYAKEHGESVLRGDYKIASMRVPAKHVWTNGDSVHEWGYHPEEKMADGGEVDAEEVFMGKGGKVKELEQYLRQREGEYGVKRLQRAFDEIPGLENMYTLQALKEAFGGDNAKALMTMNPADFEKFAVRLFSDPDTREEEMEERIERGHGLPPMSHHEYIEHLAKIKGGFADVPFLEVNKRPEYLPNISGHEGRHRSRAMAVKGAQKSLVRLLPSPSMREPMPRRYREDFIEAMKKELGEKRLVTGEGRSLLPADLEAPEHKNIERRNMLGGRPQLPEIYKDGGDVDAESVFFPKSKE